MSDDMNKTIIMVETGNDSSLATDSTSHANSLPSVIDVNNAAVRGAMVSRVVTDTIFPRKQFIVLESELESNGKLAVKCLKALQMDKSGWETVKSDIRKSLNRKRNNAQFRVRRSLYSKYLLMWMFYQKLSNTVNLL